MLSARAKVDLRGHYSNSVEALQALLDASGIATMQMSEVHQA
jgi:hypothetical protein